MPGPDFDDRTDFDDADRGLIGSLVPCVVHASDGREIWNNDALHFLEGPCPDTVNPSLWRQSQLTAKQGLYQVTEGIYQVRGLDLSNMTLVESDNGVIVIDPLVSAECASAALGLYRQHRGQRPMSTTSAAFEASTSPRFPWWPVTGSWMPPLPRTSTRAWPWAGAASSCTEQTFRETRVDKSEPAWVPPTPRGAWV